MQVCIYLAVVKIGYLIQRKAQYAEVITAEPDHLGLVSGENLHTHFHLQTYTVEFAYIHTYT